MGVVGWRAWWESSERHVFGASEILWSPSSRCKYYPGYLAQNMSDWRQRMAGMEAHMDETPSVFDAVSSPLASR